MHRLIPQAIERVSAKHWVSEYAHGSGGMSLTHNKVVTCQKTQQASPLTQLSDFAYNFVES